MHPIIADRSGVILRSLLSRVRIELKRVSAEAYQEIYGEEGTYGTNQYMELVDFAIKPHLTSSHFPKNKKENLIEVSRTYDGIIYGLRDDQAIVVNGDKTTFINGPVLSLQKGKEVKNA